MGGQYIYSVIEGGQLKTYPESASGKGEHAALESRLLALGRHTLVYTFAEPYVGLHVPRIKEDLHVRRKLDRGNFNVRCAFPTGRATWGESSETKTSKDGSTLEHTLADGKVIS